MTDIQELLKFQPARQSEPLGVADGFPRSSWLLQSLGWGQMLLPCPPAQQDTCDHAEVTNWVSLPCLGCHPAPERVAQAGVKAVSSCRCNQGNIPVNKQGTAVGQQPGLGGNGARASFSAASLSSWCSKVVAKLIPLSAARGAQFGVVFFCAVSLGMGKGFGGSWLCSVSPSPPSWLELCVFLRWKTSALEPVQNTFRSRNTF